MNFQRLLIAIVAVLITATATFSQEAAAGDWSGKVEVVNFANRIVLDCDAVTSADIDNTWNYDYRCRIEMQVNLLGVPGPPTEAQTPWTVLSDSQWHLDPHVGNVEDGCIIQDVHSDGQLWAGQGEVIVRVRVERLWCEGWPWASWVHHATTPNYLVPLDLDGVDDE